MDQIDAKIVALYQKGRSQRSIAKTVGLSQSAIHKRLRRLRLAGLVDGPDHPAITLATVTDNPRATVPLYQVDRRSDRPGVLTNTNVTPSPVDDPGRLREPGSTAGNQTLSERTVIVRPAAAHGLDLERLSGLEGKVSEYLYTLWPEAILIGQKMADTLRRESERRRADDS